MSEADGAAHGRLLELLVNHAADHLDVREFRQRPGLRCGVVNSTGLQEEVAGELASQLDIDLVCIFEVEPPTGPVRCWLRSAGEVDASKIAGLFGGEGSDREAQFTVPHLSIFRQLWSAPQSHM
mmetsp:Transcript_29966/g.79938  ORF Transcript_29966/g.79938 Transcript_29966/m.79938 type:complete len:124 (-) Transcript_29966:47-418(-)